jgi:protein transport protein SEC61 subunit alpha
MTLGEAIVYVLSGMYGGVNEIGVFGCILIIAQLFFAGVIVILLDELLQKGYGIGSGISLFIATNICENIIWKSFSPITIRSDHGTEFEGAIVALFHFLMTKTDKVSAVYLALFRQNAPNLSSLLATVFVTLIVIYFQGFRIELTIQSRKVRGYQQPYPIKLFYTSNIPIILQTALVSNLYFISQVLHKNFKNNMFVKILGSWQEIEYGNSVPTGGFAYYMSPPRDLMDFVRDPIHVMFYLSFVLLACGLFARFWVDVSGQSAKDVTQQLMN